MFLGSINGEGDIEIDVKVMKGWVVVFVIKMFKKKYLCFKEIFKMKFV